MYELEVPKSLFKSDFNGYKCKCCSWEGRRGFSSVQFSCLVVSNSLQPHELQHARPPHITKSQSLRKPMSIESVIPSNHLILCHPLLLLPSIFPSISLFK